MLRPERKFLRRRLETIVPVRLPCAKQEPDRHPVNLPWTTRRTAVRYQAMAGKALSGLLMASRLFSSDSS